MSFLKSILKYFTEEPKGKDVPKLPSEQAKKNEETQQTVFKSLFTKTDGHTITKFPYNWTSEFFPPLDVREKGFISQEILRWHSIFLEVAFEDIIELISFFIEKQPNSDKIVEYSKKHKNEYEFILIEVMHLNYMEIVKNRLEKLNDVKLLKWKPVQGEHFFEPENEEYMEIIETISKLITKEIRTQIKHLEEEERLIQLIKDEDQMEFRQNGLTDHIKITLTKNSRTIIKNAFDRLIYERSLVPNYGGENSRDFDNELFIKYCSAFTNEEGANLTFTKVMEVVHKEITHFLSVKNKDDLLRWVAKNQWPEFESFMIQEYQDLNEEDMADINAQAFTVYKLSLDFVTIILFSIYLDGIPMETPKKK